MADELMLLGVASLLLLTLESFVSDVCGEPATKCDCSGSLHQNAPDDPLTVHQSISLTFYTHHPTSGVVAVNTLAPGIVLIVCHLEFSQNLTKNKGLYRYTSNNLINTTMLI